MQECNNFNIEES